MNFAAVPPEEMGFALTLFVEAANSHISVPPTSGDVEDACDLLFDTLCADLRPAPSDGPFLAGQGASLNDAFRVLCSSYAEDPLQVSICARVLAFHLLMERTAGAFIAGWVRTIPESPQFVILHPAVIETMASVRLPGTVLLSEHSFHRLLDDVLARTDGSSE